MTTVPDLAAFPAYTTFPEYTVESAPTGARRGLAAIADKQGYLPTAAARMAHSPALLDGFLTMIAKFDATTLDPVSREVVIMTIATRNGCEVCVAMHTAKLIALGANDDLIAALRGGESIVDPRLTAIRTFTIAVLDSAGAVSDAEIQEFLAAGYDRQNALEVVLGIGAYTMSTYANRLVRAPIDPPLTPYAPFTGNGVQTSAEGVGEGVVGFEG